MRIIESVYIKRFRGFQDVNITFNKPVNAIIGRNGTMKTTLLGILAQPFSLETGEMSSETPLVGGRKFNSKMSEKFKFSDTYDKPGEHEWTLTISSTVYPKREYSCVSEKRTDTNKIRFWSTEGREKGMNYIQCPVLYLSMKRLIPIGEERKLIVEDSSLSEDEKRLYMRYHNQILISSDRITGVSSIESANKNTLGPITEYSDAITISAGQDNVGRIILAILSMKRLKDKYGEEYKGGIIFIDEFESTLYPAAQEKLIDLMYDTAYEYKLQYFFTTHSMSAISYLKTGNRHERAKVVCLQKVDKTIQVFDDPSLKDIENNLNVAAGRKGTGVNIKVYCEDNISLLLIKSFLSSEIKKKIEFVSGMNLSWTVYRTLYEHKVPEFLNSVIVLDGDVRSRDNGWKNYPKNENIVVLPTDLAPERMIYEKIFSLTPSDGLWETESLGGYTKDVCFRNNPNHMDNIDEIKDWFNSQKEYAGRGYSRFINVWKNDNQNEISSFVADFISAYNYVARRIGSQPLTC